MTGIRQVEGDLVRGMPNTDGSWPAGIFLILGIYTCALTDRQQGREQTLENGSMTGLRLHISTVRISRSQRQSSYKKQGKLDMAVLSSVLWLGMHYD